MAITADRKKNLSPGRAGCCLLVILFWLFPEMEPPAKFFRIPVEGRLAGLSCQEQRALSWAAPLAPEEKSATLRGKGGRLSPLAERSVSSRRRSALAALSSGRFDDAVADLESAMRSAPQGAELESDLAAVLLSRGRAGSDPYDYFLALEAAQRALRLEPALRPALFNRALALTQMRLLAAADEAWAAYRRAEPDGDWFEEAERARFRIPLAPDSGEDLQRDFAAAAQRGNLQGMVSVALRSPRLFREQAENVLLVDWAEATLRQDEIAASRSLRQVRYIAEALAAIHEDTTLARTVDHIELARAHSSERVSRIAAGLAAYGEGLAVAASEGFKAALKPFGRAERLLGEVGSPFARWATFLLALCRYQIFDYAGSTRLLKSLVPLAEADEEWALHGRGMSLLGLIEMIEGDPKVALGYYYAALESFRRLSERSYQAKQQALIADVFDHLGQRREAWRWLHSALITEEGAGGSVDHGTATHVGGSLLAMADGAPEIALLFQEVVLRGARYGQQPVFIVEALRRRAGILEASGRADEARRDLQEAREVLRKVPDETLARGIAGDLAFIEGRIARDHSPREALASFDRAIAVFRSTTYRYSLVLALFERARLLIALNEPTLAERDLAAAISESERQRMAIDLPSQRMSYFDQMRSLLDTMVDLQIRRLDRPQAALESSERAKARVLWDWMTLEAFPPQLDEGVEAALAPAPVEEWQCELPAGSLAIEYAVLPDRLVIWSMEACGRAVAAPVEIGAEALAALVEKFRDAISQGRERRSGELAAELYGLLIRPFEKRLAPGQPLVLIPDGPLHELPFSLLQDAATGRRLIEDHALSLAPSLRSLAASLRRDRALARDGSPRALIAAAPQAAPEFGLSELKSGSADALIADFFPGSLVLPGRRATKAAFLASSPEFEILHFGGHSIVNTESPLLSRMFFSPDAEDGSGVLFARDLLKRRFPAARLAVLASCDSGRGKVSRTEGVESLARPLLATGVPGVIATLWPVEDETTAEFFVRFYGKLAKDRNVAEALRATEIEMLELHPGPRAAFRFGAFVYVGAAFTR